MSDVKFVKTLIAIAVGIMAGLLLHYAAKKSGVMG